MRLRFLFPLFLLAVGASAFAQDDEGFQPLFNGKDLTGWVVVNTAPSTWSFNEEGFLVCSGKPIGEIRTEKMYQNFIMEVEWRHLKPRGNAGIFVWADDITARGQPFHRGVEVQVLENAYGQGKGHTTHGDIFPIHGARMTPINGRGGGRAFPTEERSKPSPEWNHYRIECNDGTISLAVNGKVVTRGKDASPKKGYICVESEGGVVHYRNAVIKVLPDTPVDPEDVAIANRGFRCLYTGVDFSGWKPAKGWKSSNWVMSAAKGAQPLTTAEEFEGDMGFIIDVRLKEDSGEPKISMRGTDLPIGSTKPWEKKGRWNRIEGQMSGKGMSVTINGTTVDHVYLVERKGTLSLIPDGPVDFANPYVRKISKDQAAAPAKPKGHLIIHGGGPLTKDVARKIFELGGGKDGHIVIVPTSAEGDLETDSESAPNHIRSLGFGKVTVLHTRDPKVADTDDFLEPLKTATAIWFSGGRQWRTMDAYLGTRAAEAFHEVYRRGGVIAGSSAGATVQGSYLVRGAPEGNHVMMAEGHEKGFGFLPGTAIDQHAIKRGRLDDMIPVIEKHPHLLGISVDEGTALLVKNGVASVLGQSKVALYDANRWATDERR